MSNLLPIRVYYREKKIFRRWFFFFNACEYLHSVYYRSVLLFFFFYCKKPFDSIEFDRVPGKLSAEIMRNK